MTRGHPTLPHTWKEIHLPGKPPLIQCVCGWRGTVKQFQTHVHWHGLRSGETPDRWPLRFGSHEQGEAWEDLCHLLALADARGGVS